MYLLASFCLFGRANEINDQKTNSSQPECSSTAFTEYRTVWITEITAAHIVAVMRESRDREALVSDALRWQRGQCPLAQATQLAAIDSLFGECDAIHPFAAASRPFVWRVTLSGTTAVPQFTVFVSTDSFKSSRDLNANSPEISKFTQVLEHFPFFV